MFDNLPVRIKSLVAPVAGSLLVLVIGAIFYMTSAQVVESQKTSGRAATLASGVLTVQGYLAETHAALFRAINWQHAKIDAKLVSGSLLTAKTDLDKALKTYAALDYQGLGIDETLFKNLHDALGFYSKSAAETADMIDIELTAADMLINDCDTHFNTVNQSVAELVKIAGAKAAETQAHLAATVAGGLRVALACVALTVVLNFLIGFFVGGVIARPIISLTNVMNRLAGGTYDIDVPHQNRRDEVGVMAGAIEVFKEGLLERQQLAAKQQQEQQARNRRAEMLDQIVVDFQKAIGGVVSSVQGASHHLRAAAESMSTTASETQDRASQALTVATGATSNVQAVASGADELHGAISQISTQVASSVAVTREAVRGTEQTEANVTRLVEAAKKISDIVDLISTIASQTNLLALNATIEAARAGEAGKGFAVVANEVKGLAAQTAKATEEISQHVDLIRAAAETAIGAVHNIGKTVAEISSTSTAISSAVQMQDSATQEIALSIQEVAKGTASVFSTIESVQKTSHETGETAQGVYRSAVELENQSQRMQQEIDQFINKVKQA